MKYLKLYESFSVNEAFKDANGNMIDQRNLVLKMLNAFEVSIFKGNKGIDNPDFEAFKNAMSDSKQVAKNPFGGTEWENVPITDEKTIKTLFDTYRPVGAKLGPDAFVWMINQLYSIASQVTGKQQGYGFITQIINNVGSNVELKSNDIFVTSLTNGESTYIDGGPYGYKYSKGGYYHNCDDLSKCAGGSDRNYEDAKVDISITAGGRIWKMEAKTDRGTKVLEKLLNIRNAFDTYSGWYEGDTFMFALYKYKAPKQQPEVGKAPEGVKSEEEQSKEPQKEKEVAEVAESKVIKTFELFTSTYQSAANKAQQKGLSGLADRFTRHGKQFGIRDKSSEITLYIEDKATKFETYYLGKVEIWDYEFKIELTNVDTDKTDWLYGMSNETNGVETYELHLNQDYSSKSDSFDLGVPTLAATRKDAKLLVDFLKENGFKYGVSDVRTLVKGYA